MKLSWLLAAISLSFTTFAFASADKDAEIKERIKPVGQVYLAGAAPAAEAEPTGPRSGAQIYGSFCIACHSGALPTAPKIGSAEWSPRLAQGMDRLLSNAINGINTMPPRGTCMDCSDDEIKAAIEHMTAGL